ncbi:MAG: hypothetical protein LAO19_19475 [Acidobacteriia bacterium]|nr:hypothetical protein [Terriglobia bacterium]
MHLNLSGLIAIAGGIYGLLAAFRIVRVSKNSESNEVWLRKFGPLMKVLSPLVILFGLAELLGILK